MALFFYYFLEVGSLAQTEKQLKNLEKGKATQFKAGEAQARIASMGGKACQEKRKRIRSMKEAFEAIGQLRCSDEEVAQHLEALGIPATRLVAATLRMADQAENGNIDAYKVWRDGIGESPKMSVGLAVEPGSAEELRQLSDAELAKIAAQADTLEDE